MEKARVYWFFGLSGSGKSTLADALSIRMQSDDRSVLRLDGDQLRMGLNKDLGFSSEDRLENVRRAAELAKLAIEQGISVVASFISPEEIHRSKVREVLGTNVDLIFVAASLETCRRRDVKGLYEQEKKGVLTSFTGVSAPFDEPIETDLRVFTEKSSVDECIEIIWKQLIAQKK